MKKELWKKVKDFPQYDVSNRGKIRLTQEDGSKKIIKARTRKRTKNRVYTYFAFIKDGVRTDKSLALIVAKAFVNKYDERLNKVKFLDGNNENFKASNLKWYKSEIDYTPKKSNLLKGVKKINNKSFKASLKDIHIGTFDNYQEANEAYIMYCIDNGYVAATGERRK